MVPEKGDFSKISAPGLLLRIAESELTGILYLKLADTLKALHFNGGRLVWAISNSVEDKIERIILEGRLVDELELQRLQSKKSGATLGKALVEKGLLSVEQLVECTRIQFKRILDDVLSWTRGGFQVIQSPPPENLFKMDMDMVSLVFSYVLENVSEKTVHAHIPDPHVRLEGSRNEERIARFSLSQKKREFLSLFDGRQGLDVVLGRYAESHHNALMKVVYFFILAGLLSLPGEEQPRPVLDFTPDPEEPQLPVIEDDEGAEALPLLEELTEPEGSHEPMTVDPPETVVNLDMADQSPESDFYSFEDSETSGDIELEVAEEESLKPVDVDAMLRDASPGKRQINVLFLLVVAILVTAGVIFILLMSGEDESPVTQSVSPRKSAQMRKVVPPPQKEIAPEIEPEPREKTEKSVTVKPETSRRAEVKGPSPLDLVRRRDYLKAAEIWHAGFPSMKQKFSILLELDCQPASVGNAFNRIHAPGEFWLLLRKLGGKTCFLVLWGRFNTAEDAERARQGLPRYFLTQNPPARVFQLAEYH